jgi:hypothetical protein
MTIKHKFISAIPDDVDESIVRPSNWNEDHDFDMDDIEIDHDLLNNLDYASAGHTGFQPALGYTPANNQITITGAGLLAGQGGDLTANRVFTLNNSDIDHDALTNFVINEHIDWTNATQNLYTLGTIQGSAFITVGEEQLADPGFDDAGEWTTGTFWSITGSQAVHFGPPSDLVESSPFTVVAGKVYKVELDIASAGTYTITIGSTAVTFPFDTGIFTMYIKAADTGSMIINSVGDAYLNSISVKPVSNGEFGDLTIGGSCYVRAIEATEIDIEGIAGVAAIGGTGGDAPDVLTIVGGDGGLGADSGDGSGISMATGNSPATYDTRGLGGDFTIATGDGRYGGTVDIDTGISEITDKGSRGLMMLNKNGGRVALGHNVTPTAKLHIGAATAQTPGNAPLKLTDNSAGLLSTIEEGTFEFDSNVLWFSRSGSLRNAFVFGAGAAYRIPYWNSANNALTVDTGFQYIYASQRLRVASGYEVFDKKVVGTQEPHIADADGSLADITTKFNTLLAQLENHGLNASA